MVGIRSVSDRGDARRFSVAEALAIHQRACADLGSPMYARLLTALTADHAAGGLTAELLEGRTDRPVHDALALRLLGAVHRIVLEGRAPALAAFYPSVGGERDDDGLAPCFLETVAAHRAEVIAGLSRQVQTNEVGRAGALAAGFHEIARRSGQPLQLREVGSSAGLLLRWDGYRYEAGGTATGDPASAVRFTDVWDGAPPRFDDGVTIRDRRGCDVSPIDATSSEGRLTLLSFVWPDQNARFRRLEAALDIARRWPVTIDAQDAGAWVEQQLAPRSRAAGGGDGGPDGGRDGDDRGGDEEAEVATVVFHAIVLQYLPAESRRRMVAALERRGAEAARRGPLAWLRMEPAGPRADLRLTTWPGGQTEVLAEVGYHGEPVRWLS
jgi:hypothetical protein